MFRGQILRANRLLLRRRLHEITSRTVLHVATFPGTKQRCPLIFDPPTKRLGHISGRDPRIALQAQAVGSLQEQGGAPEKVDGPKNATLDLGNMLQQQQRRFEELYLVDNKDVDSEQATKELNTIAQLWLDYWRSYGMNQPQTETQLGPTEMLYWIDGLSKRSHNAIRPDVNTFQHLLNGVIAQAKYCKTKDKRLLFQRRKLGELFLGRMLKLFTERDEHDEDKQSPGLVNFTPQFNKVMTLHCEANDVASGEKLLRELVRLHDSEAYVDEEKKMFPLALDSFTTMIGAYAKRGRPREAENILIWMINRADRGIAKGLKDIIMPNKDAFETCLNAWVTSSDVDAGQRAELVLLKMNELHELTRDTSFPSNTKPDLRSLSKVVAAWVNSQHKDAVLRADKMLSLMHDEELSAELETTALQKILVDTYVQVIKLWSLTDRQNAPQKISKLLGRLDEIVGLKNIKPTKLQKMYAANIHAWAWSRDPSRTARAEAIFAEMEKQREPGGVFFVDGDFFWHHSVYDALLLAYSKAGDGEKAEWLLNRMLQEYLDHGNRATGLDGPKKPDVKCWNAVMLAWSRSEDPKAVRRAEKMFHLMAEMGNNAGLDLRPDIVTYNAVLSAMVGARNIELARRGEQYFQQLKCDTSCKPTTVSYNFAMLIWSNVREPEALQKVQSLIIEMEQGDRSIWPNITSYKIFLSVLKKSELAEDEKRRRIDYVENRIEELR